MIGELAMTRHIPLARFRDDTDPILGGWSIL